MVIEYNIGEEFQKTSVVQRETEMCVCVCVCVRARVVLKM